MPRFLETITVTCRRCTSRRTGEQFNRRLADDGQTVGALIPADPGFGVFADSFVRAQRALSGRGQAPLQRFAILQRQTGCV